MNKLIDGINFDGKTVLITGGTGSFGQRCVRRLLTEYNVEKVVVFSRDEWKQSEMLKCWADEKRIRFFIGDIRDQARLQRAFHGVDIIIHAAALKQVPTLEYNPFEAVLTNIIGAENIINAAIDQGVEKVIALSTDKAVHPINLYGATKLCAEKLFVAGNAYAGGTKTRFSVVRYGNVIGSRGSVVPLFLEKRLTGKISITDEQMSRFWINLDQSVDLVFRGLRFMQGGEIFIPRIPSMKIVDLARVIAPKCDLEIIGKRPGEKVSEILITSEEAPRTWDFGGFYAIEPNLRYGGSWYELEGGKRVSPDFSYSSDTNDWWLTPNELREMLLPFINAEEAIGV